MIEIIGGHLWKKKIRDVSKIEPGKSKVALKRQYGESENCGREADKKTASKSDFDIPVCCQLWHK